VAAADDAVHAHRLRLAARTGDDEDVRAIGRAARGDCRIAEADRRAVEGREERDIGWIGAPSKDARSATSAGSPPARPCVDVVHRP
jgi:hypothetical protein